MMLLKPSPMLSDKLAVSTADGLDKVVEEILRVIIPDKPETLKRKSREAHIMDDRYFG